MSEKKGCWGCEHFKALDPETDMCELTGRKFEDRLDLLHGVEYDCPLENEESEG